MTKLIECVPNFSEGRNKDVINEITSAISSAAGVSLLDVDPGFATNRTVVTFVGSPEAVLEGAFLGIKKASELIDMSKHSGEHARMGATDVCPLIPVSDVTDEECIEYSKKLAERVAEELEIPIYLYEKSASSPKRSNLAVIRKGEYEALKEKLKSDNLKPDYGPCEYTEVVKKSGATVIGVREFLIAYNINLNTRNKKLAHDIALNIRQRGRRKRDENGKALKDENGKFIIQPGIFKECKAIGWYIPEYKQAQISMNLTNYKITPPHKVLDVVREQAAERGMVVTGSELVGLIPKKAMLDAGYHYIKKQGSCPGLSEREVIDFAVKSMGLDDISEFDPDEKVIEYRIQKKNRLIDMTVQGFTDELASDSPAPGGGSVSALMGALSCALTSMVANLTTGKKKFKKLEPEMYEIAEKSQRMKEKLLVLIDKDTEAFNKVMEGFSMPKKTDEEIAAKAEFIENATKEAITVPLETAEAVYEYMKNIEGVIERGNQNSITDAGVAVLAAKAAVKGAAYNVKINLASIEDKEFVDKMNDKINYIVNESETYLDGLIKKVEEKLS